MKLVGFIYEELKDILKENKQGFDSKICTLARFIEKFMANKVLLNVSQNCHKVYC